MKNFKKIMMMGFVLLIATLSRPVMALGLSGFSDVTNFSVVIGENMYTLEYANDLNNAKQISDAVVKNKGDVFIKTDDSGWIKNSDGTQVNKDSVDISTIKYNNDIAITQQKIAKINITSTKLEVDNVTSGFGDGHATYQVLDSLGNDITMTSLANGIIFKSGVGTVEGRNGILKVTPNMNILTFTSGIVITANDPISEVSTNAILRVELVGSTQGSTLSDIKLLSLKNVDDKVLTAGDTTTVFYAGYLAKDISGKPTTNYTLMEQGLILTGDHMLNMSSPYIVAQLVKDPTDPSVGLIKVTATSDTILMDMPVAITAFTLRGTSSTISTTLKKQAEIDSFILIVPSEDIYSGESKVIPFIALDQNANLITKFSELDGHVSLIGATFERNSDGTACIKNNKVYNPTTALMSANITAITPTGKHSSININIQHK
ncbi:hypothetical protein K2F43_00965 [Clostridium estertheticum]|uniref:hypothetical protein n=1 Tax=Clostridium estertheticum TaxID=238834 RepID=UPI001C6DF7FA|nr:hypothetical protein [Clostridium estertheticum]MBW9169772.1 hypothetical protein [Clostridium estertheticum]WLC74722.1 hypothetical protein KTC99_18500 [Clostridium estertheticum]